MEEEGYGIGPGFVFAINIVIGAGFLSLPFAFQETGVLLSLVYLIIGSSLCNYFSLMILEILHKVRFLKKWQEEGTYLHLGPRDFISVQKLQVKNPEISEERVPLDEGKIDVSKAMSIIFGRKFGIFYLLMMTISFEGALIAYGSIFASSFSSNIPLGNLDTCDIYTSGFNSSCMGHYWFFIILYSGLVTFLTIRGLKEQKSFQVIMCCMRFIIMSLVIFCSLALIIEDTPVAHGEAKPSAHETKLYDFKKSDIAIPIILFALNYQLQIPNIAELIANKEKNMWRIVTIVTITSLIWYSALGLVVPYAITDVEAQCTLNFRSYSGGYENSRPWWAQLISYVIMLFPALDVMSSFPLISIALADNWITMVYGEGVIPRRKHLITRVAVCIFPLIIAFFFYDIVKIT